MLIINTITYFSIANTAILMFFTAIIITFSAIMLNPGVLVLVELNNCCFLAFCCENVSLNQILFLYLLRKVCQYGILYVIG